MTKSSTQHEKKVIAELNDVWARYNSSWAISSVHLHIYESEILGIVGPNGGGKTTLLKVLLGLIKPERGSVRLFGHKPNKRSRLGIGYLPQIAKANRSFPVTVLDVVLMGLYKKAGLFHFPGVKSRNQAMDLLSRVHMDNHAKEPFGELSGGQQQRVNIARTLASKPRLLILDEPSTGVDTIAQEDFYELLVRFRDEDNISAVLVSHDIGVITSHADRVACLNKQIHFHGEPEFCFRPEIMQKTYGNDLTVMVHDAECITCHKDPLNDD